VSTETTTEQTTTEVTEQTTEISVSRTALALHNLAAKEESRPLLATVWTKNGRYTSADGFVAGIVKPPAEQAPPDGLMIPRPQALTAARKTTAKKRAATIIPNDNGGEIVAENKPHEKVGFMPPAGVDPTLDIPAILHKPDDVPQAALVFNAELLKQVAAFLSTATEGTDGIVELRVWSPHQAFEFRTRSADGEEVTVIQMPMVLGGYGSGGPWLFDEVPGVDRQNLLAHHVQQAVQGGAAGDPEDRFAIVRAYLAGLGYPEEHVTNALEALYAHDKQVAYEEVCGAPAEEPAATAAD
jgi:hypothetical protein